MTTKLTLPKDIADTLRADPAWLDVSMCSVPISIETVNVNFVLFKFEAKQDFQVFWRWTIETLKELWVEE